MQGIVSILALGSCFWFALSITGFIPRWLLWPMFRHYGEEITDRRFSILDFACLTAYLSIGFAASRAMVVNSEVREVMLMSVLSYVSGSVLMVVMWLAGLRALSTRGVTRPVWRVFFLLVPMPIAFVGSCILPFTMIVAFNTLPVGPILFLLQIALLAVCWPMARLVEQKGRERTVAEVVQ
jgi:hypothetical protein